MIKEYNNKLEQVLEEIDEIISNPSQENLDGTLNRIADTIDNLFWDMNYEIENLKDENLSLQRYIEELRYNRR